MSNGVAGTFVITPAIFDRWQDLACLRQDLLSCCAILGIRTGLNFAVEDAQLAAAHTAWQTEMELWLRDLLPEPTKELSHLKKAALLLSKLCDFRCITVSGEGHKDGVKPRRNLQKDEMLPAPIPLREHDILKFKDGGVQYIGWLLVYHVCEFFESQRIDREGEYESRITEEFEIDMVSGLLSARMSAQAIHLVLKALFLRD